MLQGWYTNPLMLPYPKARTNSSKALAVAKMMEIMDAVRKEAFLENIKDFILLLSRCFLGSEQRHDCYDKKKKQECHYSIDCGHVVPDFNMHRSKMAPESDRQYTQ